jgi:hypothetical protein
LLDRGVKKNIIRGLDEWGVLDVKIEKLKKMIKKMDNEIE